MTASKKKAKNKSKKKAAPAPALVPEKITQAHQLKAHQVKLREIIESLKNIPELENSLLQAEELLLSLQRNYDFEMIPVVVPPSSDEIKSQLRAGEFNQRNSVKEAFNMLDNLGNPTQLFAEHVDVGIRQLVAQRAHLSGSVGVFPPFSLSEDGFSSRSVYDLVSEKIVSMMPNRISLDDFRASGKTLEQAEAEQQRRRHEDELIQEKARMILTKKGITPLTLFSEFLNAMAADGDQHFLNNQAVPGLKFEQCSDFVLPLRVNGNHYTLVVVHTSLVEGERRADIHYYDPMGNPLSNEASLVLIKFFTDRGFKNVTYHPMAAPRDQQSGDGVNCGVFVAFKSIDMLNATFDNPERFVTTLTAENYTQKIHNFRYILAERLRTAGMVINTDGLYPEEAIPAADLIPADPIPADPMPVESAAAPMPMVATPIPATPKQIPASESYFSRITKSAFNCFMKGVDYVVRALIWLENRFTPKIAIAIVSILPVVICGTVVLSVMYFPAMMLKVAQLAELAQAAGPLLGTLPMGPLGAIAFLVATCLAGAGLQGYFFKAQAEAVPQDAPSQPPSAAPQVALPQSRTLLPAQTLHNSAAARVTEVPSSPPKPPAPQVTLRA